MSIYDEFKEKIELEEKWLYNCGVYDKDVTIAFDSIKRFIEQKKLKTNLEAANELMKEKFGIDECFSDNNCALPYMKEECSGICIECAKWWNEEYKGVVEEQKEGAE